MFKIRFMGANREVTGSCYIIEYDGLNIMVDCGLYQGDDSLNNRNREPFPFDASSIDYLFLTHAHLDHCGLIPKLVKYGFNGKIYLTSPTRDLFEITANDAAKIQKEDYLRDSNKEIIYSAGDVLNALSKCVTMGYDERLRLAEDVYVTFKQAGHILGSAYFYFEIDGKTILFTGDIGHKGQSIVKPLQTIEGVDYLVTESTYANRIHSSREETEKILIENINATIARRGNVIIPAFAIERTQELIFSLKNYISEKVIPVVPVYLDSPMAGKATKVFSKYFKEFNDQTQEVVKKGDNPFAFNSLRIIQDSKKSGRISSRNVSKNKNGDSIIVLAGSGMCTGGRILNYLYKNLPLSRTCIIFPGYQAEGTLGREIVDGAKEVYIYNKKINVRATIVSLEGFSAHADENDMIEWLSSMKQKPKKTFICHGDEEVSLDYVRILKERFGMESIVPYYNTEEIID